MRTPLLLGPLLGCCAALTTGLVLADVPKQSDQKQSDQGKAEITLTASVKLVKRGATAIARTRIPRDVYEAAIKADPPMSLQTTISYLTADGHVVFESTRMPLGDAKLSVLASDRHVAVIKVPFKIDPKDHVLDDQLAIIAELLKRVVSNTCLDGQLSTRDVDGVPKNGLQLDCRVSDVRDLGEDDETAYEIPRCAMLGATTPDTSTIPCWWAAVDNERCAATSTHVLLHVERNDFDAPINTTLVARCATGG